MRWILQVLGALAVMAAVPAAAARKSPPARPEAFAPAAPASPNVVAPPAAATAASSSAQEDTPDPKADRVIFYEYTHHVRPKDFNMSVGGGFNNFGVAAWFAIPVADDGLIPDVNDQLNVEVGLVAGLYRDKFYGLADPTQAWTLAVGGGLRWDFHVTQAWVPFAVLKVAVNFGFHQIVLPGGGLGVLYRITDDWRLRLELGYPLGFSAGLTFNLPAL